MTTAMSYRLQRTERTAVRKLRHLYEDAACYLRYRKEPGRIVNEKEIRVVGMTRTGNHPVISWIRKQIPQKSWLLNDSSEGENPFRHYYESIVDHQPRYIEKGERARREYRKGLTDKHCLIYSYEDRELPRIAGNSFERRHDMYIGKSKERIDLLILRDPFNLLASRMKRGLAGTRCGRPFADIWISYAQEFVGETHYLQNNKVVVSYNQWCSDPAYRKKLAAQLGLPGADAGLNDVMNTNGEHRPEEREPEPDTENMNVLNRWEAYMDNLDYWVELKPCVAYSERIFGVIPKTIDFVAKMRRFEYEEAKRRP